MIQASRELKVRITFLEEVLGTANSNPDIHRDFIASKAPSTELSTEEVENINIVDEDHQGVTIFPKTKDGTPIFYNYQWKGFFKDACGMLRKVTGSESSKIKSYKKEIDGLIFIKEREIPINMNGGKIGHCERPLRASTPQGERIALANSESIGKGATCEFTILLMCNSHTSAVLEWLDYGELRGTGCWRNSGKGIFSYEILEDSEGKLASKPTKKTSSKKVTEPVEETSVEESEDKPKKRGRKKKSETVEE